MKRFLLAVVMAVLPLVMGSANADWYLTEDEDPFEDTKIVTAHGVSGTYKATLGFKCWQDRSDETLFVLALQDELDVGTVSEDETVIVSTRVDKGKIRDIKTSPRFSSDNVMTLLTNFRENRKLVYFFKDVGKAKSRIAVRYRGKIHSFSAKGSTKAIRGMINGCKMPPPTAEKD